MGTRTWLRSPSAVSLAVAATLAIVQAVLFATSIATQRNAAHIVDVSGLQRMQSQRIAFLAQSAHDGRPPAHWKREMDAALARAFDARRELGGNGGSGLERMADRYIAAARVLERDPSNERAYAAIRDLRIPLLQQYDRSVKARVARLTDSNDGLVAAIAAGLLVQLGIIALTWLRMSAPAERAVTQRLAVITKHEEHTSSLFHENPDGVAIYDEHGHLVRVNRARAALGGHGLNDFIGAHFSTFLREDIPGGGPDAFQRAASGETVAIETQMWNSRNEPIDVKMTFFPNIVHGKPKGVIVISKDVRALKAAQRLYAEQSERLADLYAIAAAHGKSMRQRIADALALAARHLDYQWAGATEISNGKSSVVATFGDPAGAAHGAHEGLHRSIQAHLSDAQEIWSVDDLADSTWLRGTTGDQWKSMTGMRIEADGVLYGVFAFASNTVRKKPLSEGDRHFLRLVSALLGSIIERDQRERKLDSLAFFDALTGLPNRVLLLDRLEELVSAARHRNVHFALFYIDLDFFKAVNDEHGHGAGDAVLRAVATRLQQCVRETDTVARLGGDEFVVLQTKADGAAEFAARVVRTLSEPIPVRDQMMQVGASVGIAMFPQDADGGSELLAAGDRALYASKRGGRNRFAFASDVSGDGLVAASAAVAPESDKVAEMHAKVTPIRKKRRKRVMLG